MRVTKAARPEREPVITVELYSWEANAIGALVEFAVERGGEGGEWAKVYGRELLRELDRLLV